MTLLTSNLKVSNLHNKAMDHDFTYYNVKEENNAYIYINGNNATEEDAVDSSATELGKTMPLPATMPQTLTMFVLSSP